MSFEFTEIREYIRIKGKKINVKVLTASGKDGEFNVTIAPTLMVSGYGKTEAEAKVSFEHNMELFCQDLLVLSQAERKSYLLKLGFIKEKFTTKNYSKLYVDQNGLLQGLEQSSLKTSMLEAIV